MRKLLNAFKNSIFPGKNSPELPIITISREKGSGGRHIAYITAEKLGEPWKIYHQDTLEHIAKEKEMKQWFSKQISPKEMQEIDSIIHSAFGDRYNELSPYYQDLMKLLAMIGRKGYAVIVGRGAHFLFPHALNVRLICTIEQRIEWLMRYEHVSNREALKLIEESDKEREQFIQALYGESHHVPYHFDLIIRTSAHIKLEDAAATIIHLAKRRFKL